MVSTGICFILLCLTVYTDESLGLSTQRQFSTNQFTETTPTPTFYYTTGFPTRRYTSPYYTTRSPSQVAADSYALTFQYLGDGYGKDNRNVYYNGKIVIGANVAYFRYLGGGYGTDTYNVYHMGQSVASSSL